MFKKILAEYCDKLINGSCVLSPAEEERIITVIQDIVNHRLGLSAKEDNLAVRVQEEVVRWFDILPYDLRTSNKEECVNARSVAIAILADAGYTDSEINLHLGIPKSSITRIRNEFRDRQRQRYAVRVAYKEITSIIRNN